VTRNRILFCASLGDLLAEPRQNLDVLADLLNIDQFRVLGLPAQDVPLRQARLIGVQIKHADPSPVLGSETRLPSLPSRLARTANKAVIVLFPVPPLAAATVMIFIRPPQKAAF
jgi:hypothetical protein